ncbi:Hypothetical_protein [Hexamita inflata]|uniref:Hypothetical_protein n=1 Tax=Hexamita inflata TaxID=28002 RepID=A0ABP1GJA8_9EUKA
MKQIHHVLIGGCLCYKMTHLTVTLSSVLRLNFQFNESKLSLSEYKNLMLQAGKDPSFPLLLNRRSSSVLRKVSWSSQRGNFKVLFERWSQINQSALRGQNNA